MNSRTKSQIAWALYDWGNSAFATTVLAGLFPVFFKQYWRTGVPPEESTAQLAVFNTAAGVLIALLAPLLGAIADCAGGRKRLLALFTMTGTIATASLALVGQEGWLAAGLLFAAGIVSFQGAIIFYDALIVEVAQDREVDWVSALGYSLGYLGGGLLFALNVAMTLKPEWFGLSGRVQAVKVSFVTVALWWGAFTVPLLLGVRERTPAGNPGWGRALHLGLHQLRGTLRELLARRPLLLFLVAYIIYIDGVGTVIRMATDFGLSIGLRSDSLITALLLVQFIGFPAALAFGKLGQKIGARKGILIGLGVYTGAILWGSQMTEGWEFYILAALIGLVQGGVQALSRSFFARLVPPARAGEFFGLYNMVGKFAALFGPALMGTVTWVSGSTRIGIVSLVLLFVVGGGLLMKVDLSRDGS